jgi:hypothetical protein
MDESLEKWLINASARLPSPSTLSVVLSEKEKWEALMSIRTASKKF